ncbi:hypothetical protein OB13_01920 [Pontibacter sp. HJ8]
MMETEILKRTHVYVAHQLPTNGSDQTNNPTLQHTQALVATAEEIGRASGLPEHELQLLLLAAWLHDLSNTTAAPLLADSRFHPVEFLESSGLSAAEIKQVQQGIAATRYPQHPQNKLEEVLCDAVASFLASEDYLVQQERKARLTPGDKQEELGWIKAQRNLLKKHTYFTPYARQTYAAGIEHNVRLLKQKQQEFIQSTTELQAPAKGKQKSRKNRQQAKEQKALKGVETMFRTTMASHLQLSAIADSKANIMISINAIIASIMLSSFIKSFSNVPHLIIPAFLLTTVCILTTIIAVLATRPNIKSRALGAGKIDLLFFGDYTQLSADVYRSGMRELMQDPDRLYNTMIDNIYLQGKVLEKKYRLLKLSYTVFWLGLCIVLVSYAVAWFYFR